MPQESQLAHRVLTNLALPYQTNTSPTITDPHFILGSFDILTSINGYAERRPGFSTNVEPVPTTFNNLQRLFPWDRFDGSFYIMACDVNANKQAVVYKFAVGVDQSFVPIWIDNNNTPFDFVTSNNTVYFGNGITMKKWDPVNGISNWGIANTTAPASAYAGTATDVTGGGGTFSQSAIMGTAADGGGGSSVWTFFGGGTIWTNTIPGASVSNPLYSTNYGFTIPGTATIVGIKVTTTGAYTGLAPSTISDGSVHLLKAGVPQTANKANGISWTNAGTALTYGNSLDTWGESPPWTPTDINNSGFGVAISATNVAASNRTGHLNGQTITVYYTLPGSPSWTNPSNLTGAPDAAYATSSLPPTSDVIQATNYGFAIAGGASVGGVSVQLTGHISNPIDWVNITATLLVGGVAVGTPKVGIFSHTSDTLLTFGGSGDNWGVTSLSPTTVNTSTFGVQFTANSANGNPEIISLDAAQITLYLSNAPTVTLSGTGLTGTYQYVYCYCNSKTGHLSSPTAPSFPVSSPANQQMNVAVVASTDPQVNQIRIFRTTTGATGLGGQAYFEIPNSPVPNVNATIPDNAPDSSLNALSIAPTPTFNDPPIGSRGFVYFSGRIWGFTKNQVWFTGLEEITIGVPEESMPSGVAGNFWNFDEPVQGLGVGGIGSNQGLAIFCGGKLYGIQGNSLDTFVRFQVSNRRGARNLTCIATLGGMLAWLDSADQVWATDGTNLNELSPMIRPDLQFLNQASCCVTFHTAGRFHWLVLSTGTRLYVYDIDQDQWMPPWTFSATYINSGEISPGNYVLLASNGTKALQLNPNMTAGTFNDNGVTYQPIMKFGLLSVVPDYGTRFSYIGVGSYNEPTRTGYPSVFQITNNGNPPTDFLICQDDDPTVATYTSIVTNVQDPATTFNRAQGTNMKQFVFPTLQPAARWIGMEVKLEKADQADREYEIFMAYKGLGGR